MTRQEEFMQHSQEEGFPRPKGVARSAFGIQADSRRSTHPIHSFTRLSTREEAGKVFLSKEHCEVQKGRAGPHGQYKLPAALGAQPTSPKRTAPQYSFSHLDRLAACNSPTTVPGPGTYKQPSAFGSQAQSLKETCPRCPFGTADKSQVDKVYVSKPMLSTKLGTEGADPGVYDLPQALGRQPCSQKRTSPAFTLSRTSRLRSEYDKLTASVPPPGKYETWTSIGEQALSQCRTAPATEWAKGSTWDAERTRFLSLSHARLLQGTASPANFDHQNEQNLSAFGKQPLSRRASPSRTAFGHSQRFVFKVADTPGPGHYD